MVNIRDFMSHPIWNCSHRGCVSGLSPPAGRLLSKIVCKNVVFAGTDAQRRCSRCSGDADNYVSDAFYIWAPKL